jgi:hypothetical protein
LTGGKEEERMINGCSTARPSIVQPPTITIPICLVGGWKINNHLKWRRTTILLAWEKEQIKQRRPCGPVQRIEPHQIAQWMRPMRAKRRWQRRGGATLFGRSMKAATINNSNGYIQGQWLHTAVNPIANGYSSQLSTTAINNGVTAMG